VISDEHSVINAIKGLKLLNTIAYDESVPKSLIDELHHQSGKLRLISKSEYYSKKLNEKI